MGLQVKQSLVGVSDVQRLKVRATDRGTPKLYSEGYVEIRVGSASGQQTFKFLSSSYYKDVEEDARSNALVRTEATMLCYRIYPNEQWVKQ